MVDAKPRYTDDVPDDIEVRVRKICLALPDAYEERAWVGTRWMVRKRTFAHVFGVETANEGSLVVMSFRPTGEEWEMLRNGGHPFFALGWGRGAIGMVLGVDTNWDEASELERPDDLRIRAHASRSRANISRWPPQHLSTFSDRQR